MMSDFFTTPTAQLALSMLILSVLLAAGVWLVSIFRDRTDKDGEAGSEVLSIFEEMVQEGDISVSEFRTIEAVMDEKNSNHGKEFE